MVDDSCVVGCTDGCVLGELAACDVVSRWCRLQYTAALRTVLGTVLFGGINDGELD